MNSCAVIIINWNSFQLTYNTVKSLGQSTYKDFDIVLIDNNSTDGSGLSLKEEFRYIKYIQSKENLGFTGGNNLGLQYAIDNNYKYCLLLNNDVEVEPNFLELLIQKIESNSNIGAVQPLIYFHHNRNLIWNAGSRYCKWLGIPYTLTYNKPDAGHLYKTIIRNVDWLTGCALLVKTEVLKKVGLLKQDYFIYYEDVDLSFRIKEAGYKLAYEPKSVIYHIAGMAHKSHTKGPEGFQSPKVHYLNARNRIWFLKQFANWWELPTIILYQFFYYAGVSSYFLLRGRIGKWKAWNTGTIHGLLQSIK